MLSCLKYQLGFHTGCFAEWRFPQKFSTTRPDLYRAYTEGCQIEKSRRIRRRRNNFSGSFFTLSLPFNTKTRSRIAQLKVFFFLLQLKSFKHHSKVWQRCVPLHFFIFDLKRLLPRILNGKAGSIRGLMICLDPETRPQLPLAGKKSWGATQYVWTESKLVVLISKAI